MARIGIDARFYGPVGKGLGRYTQQVVDNIIKLAPENQYVIFLRRENFYLFKNGDPRVKKVLADVKWYTLAEQIIMPLLIWRQRLDLMHFPHFNVPILCPVKFTVTIHDLILLKYPTTRATTLGPGFYKIKNWAYALVIELAVKRARRVITVSEFTKNDVTRQFKIKADKVVVTYEGITDLCRSDKEINPAEVMKKYFIEPPFLLYIGNAYPHKNLEGLIRVFAELECTPLIKGGKGGLKLVLVGKEDYFYRRLKTSAPAGSVIFPGYVPDEELKAFYSSALAYIFPSFYEGFGLPPLEAMAHGLPVLSSDRTSMPEILGDAALYFNPTDDSDMKNKIERLIEDDGLRAEMRDRGFKQIKKYSWRDCAVKTLEVYKSI